MNIYKKEIKRIFEKYRKMCPGITDDMLLDSGAIYYMNGNDGTDFDWRYNGRLCEFCIYFKNEIGFIKVFVNCNNKIDVFIYRNAGMYPTHSFEDFLEKDCKASDFCENMLKIADEKCKWDAKIDDLDFT